MARKYVYEVYPNLASAEEAIDVIVSQGVPRSSIVLVGSERDSYLGNYNYITYTDLYEEKNDDNRGFFAKLFGLDREEDYDAINLDDYQTALSREEYLVLVDEEYRANLSGYRTEDYEANHLAGTVVDNNYLADQTDHVVDTDPLVGTGDVIADDYRPELDPDLKDRELDGHDLNETERIRLHEEEITAETRRHDVGEVEITKEVVEDIHTVEVPVEREEIHIRHTTPTDGRVDDDAFTEEEIVIPITEEEVVLNKETRVVGEVEIEKRTHVDHKTVDEGVRREELEVHDEAGIVIEDDNEPLLDANDPLYKDNDPLHEDNTPLL